jgi:hypothetical protein
MIVNRFMNCSIASNPSVVASRTLRMDITWPQSYVTDILSASVGVDLLGCINRTRQKKKKVRKQYTFPPQMYSNKTKNPASICYSSMANFQLIRRTKKLHLPGWVEQTPADSIYTGPISNPGKTRRVKQENIRK